MRNNVKNTTTTIITTNGTIHSIVGGGGGNNFERKSTSSPRTLDYTNSNNNKQKLSFIMNRLILFGALLLFIYLIYVMLKFHSTVKSNESTTNNRIKSEFISEDDPSTIKNIIKEQIEQEQQQQIEDKSDADNILDNILDNATSKKGNKQQLDGNIIDTTNIDSVNTKNVNSNSNSVNKNTFSTSIMDEEAQIELVCNLNIQRSDSCYNNCNKINEMKKELELYCKPKDSDESLMKCTNLYNSLICQTNNLVMDLQKISKSNCLKYRSQYNCVNNNVKSMYVYEKNAFKLNCNINFRNSKFSIDFQKDYFNSFNYDTFKNLKVIENENLVTILVFRENGIRNEINNIYYFINELYNTYMVIELFDLGVEWDLIHIVFMDEHENSKFDSIWKLMFKQTRQLNQIYPEMNQLVKFQHLKSHSWLSACTKMID
ncbi:predicted protein [Naegleria gruberi]|uniref:Predicted protein n=1 Tax=Naegleria gruberi TaxID=5762 RepID=D2UYR1_NAEGR|nr:uncharacterized protein NAEGRDRAFT_61558 [Naegleria gruberi]EFC50524.1 predicted protein [Naegleria gruberi]|eukprot:XP_002683268.1 predicted protein [Naegleria gruberi strain NEG-M]